eukprot:COSAG06_NODE_42170_length_384_cov_0.775439_2_plen_40_part_01
MNVTVERKINTVLIPATAHTHARTHTHIRHDKRRECRWEA